MSPRLLIVALAAAVALVPSTASAQVTVAGTGEPAFTRSAQNTQWVTWPATSGADGYRLRYSYERDSAPLSELTYDKSVGGSTADWVDWNGVAALEEGRTYGICVQGSYSFPNDSLFFPDGPDSCESGEDSGKRTTTTIDRSKPTVSVQAAGGAAATRHAVMQVRVDYQDAYSPPFPANFLCVAPGADANAACGSAIFGYTPSCSTPAAVDRVTSFNCQVETGGTGAPDGPLFVCAISADSSIPDNPSSPDQSGSAVQANLSDKACDSVLVDRTAPSAAIGAPATSVQPGQSVTFTAQASDATSGLGPEPARWSFDDGSPASSGDSATHTFARPGAYTVRLEVADAAGNETTASRRITVADPSTGEDGDDGTAGPGQSGGGPTAAQIIDAAGGGTAQRVRLGEVTVLAPRRVRLTGRRRSILLGVTADQPGLLQLRLVKGSRVRARASAVLAAGSKAQRLRLPKGMRPGRHALKVAFTPAGSSSPVATSLRINFVRPGRRAAGAQARGSSLPGGPRVSAAGLPAPGLPDGRLRRR
jgi:plastocyanin